MFHIGLEFDLDLEIQTIFNVSLKISNIHYKNKYHKFDELWYMKSVQPIIYHNPLHLFLAAILDAILDFSARTNNDQCILADS